MHSLHSAEEYPNTEHQSDLNQCEQSNIESYKCDEKQINEILLGIGPMEI